MASFSKNLGIDLGTIQTRIADASGILVDEPTVVAIAISEQKMVEFGKAARDMFGRVQTDTIEVAHPLQNGVVADYEITEALLRYLLQHVSGPMRFFRPRVMVSVPYGVTSVESRAVHEAALQAGSRDVHLIQQPLAAAIGVGLPVATPSGNMVVQLGGGVTQAAVLAMSGIVSADAVRIAGNELDEAIATYVRKKHGLIIGLRTAAEAKIRIGAAIPQDEDRSIEVQGQDQVTSLPRPVVLTTHELVDAIQETLQLMLGAVRNVLERTPPELASDIIDKGMVVCGGTALLRGMDKWLTRETGIPAYL